jgi:hypothetical protein
MNTYITRQCDACGEAWIPSCFSHCPECDAKIGYRFLDIMHYGIAALPTVIFLGCVVGLIATI